MRKISGRSYAFSAFVFEPDSGELTRGTTRLRIPDQEARVLTVLVENPGVVITRDQLRSVLWAQDEILDHDRSINRAVSQLRAILRDRSPKSAELIETLPKRGYRFIVPVQQILSAEAASELAVLSPSNKVEPSDQLPSTGPMFRSGEIMAPERAPALAVEISPFRPTAQRGAGVRRDSLWFFFAVAGVLIAIAVLWFFHARHPAANHAISLGIVPMETSGEGAAALAEGFRLNLADILSQSPEVETRSVHAFDHIGQDETQTLARARQMNVDVLLFGKFTVQNDRCDLHLELVRSSDGVHLNSLLYSGSKEELASISDRVERDIFDRLHPNGQALAIPRGRPRSARAYAQYLEGRLYLQQWTDDSLHKAISAFGEALKEDPLYARADAGMASAYYVLAQHAALGQDESLEKARHFSSSALALDPDLAEAHAILGQTLLTKDWDFPHAEQHLYRAVELDPEHAIYHQWLSILLGIERKYSLALKEVDKAHAANPDWPPLYMTEIYLADSAGQFDRSKRAAGLLLQKMPDWSLAHEQCALSNWAQGDYEGAIAQWRQAAVLEKDADRVQLEDEGLKAFRSGGVPAFARLRLEAIRTHKGISHEEQDFVPAQWYAYADDRSKAFEALEAMVHAHSASALQIADDPAYRLLQKDPRFIRLLMTIGIAPSAS